MTTYTFQTEDKYEAKCMMHSLDLASTIEEIKRIVRQQLKHEQLNPVTVLEQVMDEVDEVIFMIQE